jgi:hypothetical protein
VSLALVSFPRSSSQRRSAGVFSLPLKVHSQEQAINNSEDKDESSTYQALCSALDRMQRLQNFHPLPENDKMWDSFRNLLTRCSKYVEVAPSPIAGKGLFAKKSIPKFTIISFYPVHVLGIEYDDVNNIRSQYVSLTEDYVPDKENSYRLYLLGQRPLIGNDVSFSGGDGCRVYVDVDKNCQSDTSGWLSHYSNDGTVVKGLSETDMLDYYQQTKEHRNCVLIPFGPAPIMATMTTRKVAKGQELFTSYGVSYWLENLVRDPNGSLSIQEEYDNMVIPDLVEAAAKEFARELVNAVQTAHVRYKAEQGDLNSLFRAL